MVALRVIGWLYIGIAAIVIVAGAAEETFGPVALGVAAIIAGVLVLALDRIVSLLTDIRDRLPVASPDSQLPADRAGISETTMTISELDAKLAATKEKHRGTLSS